MTIRLNRSGFDLAQRLVETGAVVRDERVAWAVDQPSSEDEDTFIREHGIDEYARWHLAIDDGQPEDSKRRYRFLFGDFRSLHRCAVLDAGSRAGGDGYSDVAAAAEILLRSLDALV